METLIFIHLIVYQHMFLAYITLFVISKLIHPCPFVLPKTQRLKKSTTEHFPLNCVKQEEMARIKP